MKTVEAKNIFGETIKVPVRGKHYIQPKGYAAPPGTGPKGKLCRDCIHRERDSRGWSKCALAHHTGGRGTDILAKAPACLHFKEEKMTENKAKEKWCPFARVMGFSEKGKALHGGAGNRTTDIHDTTNNPSSCHCIGSECMAWRETKEKIQRMHSLESELERLAPSGWERDDISPDDTLMRRIGYCGLAGKP